MFFSPDGILENNFLLNFITSKRGAGKTFGCLKFCVQKFIDEEIQFVYMRRTETEIELARDNLLTPLKINGYFEDKTFKCKENRLYVDNKTCGYCVSLSTAYKLKSVSFEKVKYIIFDEFIDENGRYLKNEVEKFLSIIETIGRMRDIQIICLANQITKYNPYYIYFKVFPSESDLTRFRKLSILIYEYKAKDYTTEKLKTKFGNLVKNTRYGNYLIENENIQDDFSFIDKLENIKKQPIANLIIENKNFVMYECEILDDYVLFFKIRENIKELQTLNFDKMLVENATLENLKSNPTSKRISYYIKNGNVRFFSMLEKKIIENFIF